MDRIENSAAADSLVRAGGEIPDSGGVPAFVLRRPRPLSIPVLIAVPHAGRHYTDSVLGHLRQPQEAALRLEDRYVDLVADAVARQTGAALLMAAAPRAMIDLNRSPDDVDWDMIAGGARPRRSRLAAGRRARSGLGLIPRRLTGLGDLWNAPLPAARLSARIEQVHQPYHLAAAKALESMRDRWGAALLIDLHSMPPLGPKHGADAAADYVVGDRFGASCDGRLAAAALDWLDAAGGRADYNRPYAGGYVLDRHGAPSRQINALQIEICRTAYLDEFFREPGPGMAAVVATVTGLVRHLADRIVESQAGLAQAAE